VSHQFEVGYWKIRGFGAPLRMMAYYSGCHYVNKTYDFTGDAPNWDTSSWFQNAKPALAAKNPLINLPYIIDGDLIVTLSNPCFLYLARKLHLNGKTPEETNRTEQVLFQVYDLRNDVSAVWYGRNPDIDGLVKVTVPTHLTKLEAWFSAHKTPFCAGNEPTVGDFNLWEIIDIVSAFGHSRGVNVLEKYPLLTEFHGRFKALPALVKYFESPESKYPVNAPMAIWK